MGYGFYMSAQDLLNELKQSKQNDGVPITEPELRSILESWDDKLAHEITALCDAIGTGHANPGRSKKKRTSKTGGTTSNSADEAHERVDALHTLRYSAAALLYEVKSSAPIQSRCLSSSSSNLEGVISLVSSDDDEGDELTAPEEGTAKDISEASREIICYLCHKHGCTKLTSCSKCRLSFHVKCLPKKAKSPPKKSRGKKKEVIPCAPSKNTPTICLFCEGGSDLLHSCGNDDLLSFIKTVESGLAPPLTALRAVLTAASRFVPSSGSHGSSSSASTSSSSSSSSSSSNRETLLLKENAAFDILRCILDTASLFHQKFQRWQVPTSALVQAFGLAGKHAPYLSKCPIQFTRQLEQRGDMPSLGRRRVTCSRQDVSGFAEICPIVCAADAPDNRVDALIHKFQQDSDQPRGFSYSRYSIESQSLRGRWKAALIKGCACKTTKGNMKHVSCNAACACALEWRDCGGRKMQLGVCDGLELFWRDDIEQWGVRTTRDVPRGRILAEYTGLIQSTPVSNRNLSSATLTTAFAVTDRIEVEASRFRNLAYFINGCCKQANVEVKRFKGNTLVMQLKPGDYETKMARLMIVARRKIKKGHELELCYDAANPRQYLNGKVCKCSACRLKKSS